MKKYAVVLTLLLALAMVLSACGTTATTEAPTAQPTEPATQAGTCPLQVEEGAVITFSGWGDESEQKIYKDTIERFKRCLPRRYRKLHPCSF